MKRLHQPIGRYFDANVEAFADMMMENPSRTQTDMQLKVDARALRRTGSSKATVTMPNGDVLQGFFLERPPLEATNEIMCAMLGTDLGVPTVPYIYINDRAGVFSPLPFADAVKRPGAEESSAYKPDTMGAIEPFMRLINKNDDLNQNRVRDDDGNLAVIDNAMLVKTNALLTVGGPQQLVGARASCTRGPRHRLYHAARRAVALRIQTYPAERFAQLAQIASNINGHPTPEMKQSAKRVWSRRPMVGAVLGVL